MTPSSMIDKRACFKGLTSYFCFTIKKATPMKPTDKPTWAMAEVVREKVIQGEIVKQIEKLNIEDKETLAEKKSLAQIGKKNKTIDRKMGMCKTITMTVYCKRTLPEGLNPIKLYQNLKGNRLGQLAAQKRTPPTSALHWKGESTSDRIPRNLVGNSDPKITPRAIPIRPPKRPPKRYADERTGMLSVDESDSDSASESDSSSSGATYAKGSMPTDQHRRYSDSRFRNRSSSHRRERSKAYYIESRPESRDISPEAVRGEFHEVLPKPRDFREDVPSLRRPFAHEFPRPISSFNSVAAAYQAGKLDAEAEIFGRHPPVPRPVIVKLAGATISYGK
ncbi:hypothetical protein G7Y89_g12167 [Cudoniella acicularis]|uniref:Uncharacterized protein n=1 Tax=Cudoniella acicularis TaxID=354080 RepID=A0A8H4VZX5_9HELO|nr:hypothetical protein G7Y89_g12167 [Cudoniella acicularis]